MKEFLKYLIPVLCLGCGTNQSNKLAQQPIDNIEFPLVNPKVITSKSDSLVVDYLDSLMRSKWSDKIMGRYNLYSSGYLAKFKQTREFRVFAIKTSADDWSKSFLITADSSLELIDFIEITDSFGDARSDGSGKETVTEIETKTAFVSDSIFLRTRMNTTIYSYRETNEQTMLDSISEMFKISKLGKFELMKSDSLRINK